MARIPAQASRLLTDLTAALPEILAGNLVGLYLYGTLTQRAFDPARSDIDGIVVTERELIEAQFEALGSWLARQAEANPWTVRLQLSCLLRDEVLTMNAKACSYPFGVLRRSGSDGNPIIWPTKTSVIRMPRIAGW